MRRAVLALLVPVAAVGALQPTSARAVEPVTVVVYGLPAPEEDAIRQAWIGQTGTDAATRFSSMEEVLPAGEVVLLGDVEVERCAAGPQPAAALLQFNQRIIEQLTEMEYLSASASLDAGEQLIACLNEAPDPRELGLYHFLAGVVAFHAQGPGVATDRFEEALLVSPFLQWDDRYPPSVRPSFDKAVSSAMTGARAFVSVSGHILDAGKLWIDGVGLDVRTRTTTIYEGTHLVQWRPHEGEVQAWLVKAKGAESLVLVHRQDAVRDLLTGQADADLTAFVRSQVLAPVEQGPGGNLVAAQQDGDVVLFHRYEQSSGRWRLADLGRLDRYRARGRELRTAGIATTIGGLVLAGVGAGLGIEASAHAAGLRESLETDVTLLRTGNLVAEYAEDRTRVSVGWTVGIAGGVIALGGVPLQIVGGRRARGGGYARREAVDEATDGGVAPADDAAE